MDESDLLTSSCCLFRCNRISNTDPCDIQTENLDIQIAPKQKSIWCKNSTHIKYDWNVDVICKRNEIPAKKLSYKSIFSYDATYFWKAFGFYSSSQPLFHWFSLSNIYGQVCLSYRSFSERYVSRVQINLIRLPGFNEPYHICPNI